MNKWTIVAIVGLVILIIGIALSIYGANSVSNAVSSSLDKLKSEPYTTLKAGEAEQITVPANSYELLLYNSTAPLQIKNVTQTYAAGIYEAALISKSEPTNFYLTNNNTVPVNVKYVAFPVNLTLVTMAGVGVLILFVGLIISIVGGIAAIISRFRKKRDTSFGQPPAQMP